MSQDPLQSAIVDYFDSVASGRDVAMDECPSVAFEQALRHDFIMRCARTTAPFRVLDVGCGTGRDTLPLSAYPSVGEVVAVDLSAEMIAVAAEAATDLSARIPDLSRIRFFKGDARDLPDSYGRDFDLVICSEVLEHVPDWTDLIVALADLCAESGHVVITVPNRRSLHGLNRRLVEWRNLRMGKAAWPHPCDDWKAPIELRYACIRAGLKVVEESGLGYLPGFTIPYNLPKQPARMLVSLAAAIHPAASRIFPRLGHGYGLLLRKSSGYQSPISED